MRYLCIDLGEKRTGLALGDDETRFVSPLEVVSVPRRSEALMQAIIKTIDQQKPGALVIGMPFNMDGSVAASAKQVRQFGEVLAGKVNLPVHFQDERLTSYAADQRMAQTGRTHKQKKQLRDALAAAEILRDFLESQKR